MNHEVEITTCRELLGLYKPERAQVRTISTLPIDFHRYEELQRAGWKLIRSLSDRASRQAGCEPEESFEPFIFGWIALNGWASCVTGVEKGDTPYLGAMMLDPELNRRFSALREQPEFQERLKRLDSFWPILRPLPQSRITNAVIDRQELVRQELDRVSKDSRFRPECAARHYLAGEEIPMDWPHTLSAIYQVRCNLFHGSKSLHSDIDTRIVLSSFSVLVHVLPMLDV